MPSTPNLLFIFPDQLAARWTSVEHHPAARTPNLKWLADHSHVFSCCCSSSPLCTPFRGALLTGRYPTQTGIRENGQALPPGFDTLAHQLEAGGHHTIYLGKWHLSGDPQCNRWVPPEARGGFRTFIGWESHHVDHWDGKIWADDPDTSLPMPGHETDALTDIALDRLAALQQSQDPFAMFVSYQAPHPPCSPPDAFRCRAPAEELFADPAADRDAWYDMPGWNASYSVEKFRRRYFGEIAHLDAAVGRLLASLDSSSLGQRTIVVFTSDHGEMAGCHGLFSKHVMYDESLRVPLLIRMPGQDRRIDVPQPFGTVDFRPTLLDLLGGGADRPAPLAAEGRSFAPFLAGEAPAPNGPVFSEYHDLCVCDGKWKLIADRNTLDPKELFHVAEDGYEQHNRLGDPQVSDHLGRLQYQLADWWQHVVATTCPPVDDSARLDLGD